MTLANEISELNTVAGITTYSLTINGVAISSYTYTASTGKITKPGFMTVTIPPSEFKEALGKLSIWFEKYLKKLPYTYIAAGPFTVEEKRVLIGGVNHTQLELQFTASTGKFEADYNHQTKLVTVSGNSVPVNITVGELGFFIHTLGHFADTLVEL